jgi:hypothetical protein
MNQNQNQNQKPLLEVLTPIKDKNLPFDQISIEEAFNIWAQPKNWNLGLKLLSINFNLNKVLFTWAFDTQFYSTFILVYTCKGQFLNSDLNQRDILDLLEMAFNDEEINGDGDWDYTFNGVTLVVTIKHIYD